MLKSFFQFNTAITKLIKLKSFQQDLFVELSRSLRARFLSVLLVGFVYIVTVCHEVGQSAVTYSCWNTEFVYGKALPGNSTCRSGLKYPMIQTKSISLLPMSKRKTTEKVTNCEKEQQCVQAKTKYIHDASIYST